MYRLLTAVTLAFLLAGTGARAESAQSHAAAAKKAERAHNWSRALQEWQEAYKLDLNADYLVGMGDAYAKMGDKDNARKQYQAYLADPLAANTSKVQAKIAALDAPSLDLPGGAPGLPGLPDAPAASASTGLDLPGLPAAAPAPEASGKRGRKGRKGDAAPGLDLPGADAPGLPGLPGLPDAPAATAQKAPAGGLDLPSMPEPKKDVKVAAADPLALPLEAPAAKKPARGGGLDLPSATPPVAVATLPPPPAAKEPVKVAVASPPPAQHSIPAPAPHNATPAVATSTPKPRAPPDAIIAAPVEQHATAGESHAPRFLAYTTAGIAVASLAVGGLFYTQASQDQNDLTAQVRTGAQQQALIEQQKQHKSLAFAGFAAGLVTAGLATALFVF